MTDNGGTRVQAPRQDTGIALWLLHHDQRIRPKAGDLGARLRFVAEASRFTTKRGMSSELTDRLKRSGMRTGGAVRDHIAKCDW